MEGMASGESRDVAITMPDTWDPPQLRGARVNCSVTVNEIFEWELPEVRIRELVSSTVDLSDRDLSLRAVLSTLHNYQPRFRIITLSHSLAPIICTPLRLIMHTQHHNHFHLMSAGGWSDSCADVSNESAHAPLLPHRS